jgi:uncharacterized membrane protein (Fun14 family)
METLVYIIAVALAILLGLILYGTIAKNKWGVVTIDRETLFRVRAACDNSMVLMPFNPIDEFVPGQRSGAS